MHKRAVVEKINNLSFFLSFFLPTIFTFIFLSKLKKVGFCMKTGEEKR
jgi:hypothetical protein